MSPSSTLLTLSQYKSGGYTTVTSGSNCARITSQAECEEVARQLGLADTVASTESVDGWPPNCYFIEGTPGNLWFNSNDNSPIECGFDTQKTMCLCKKTSSSGIDIYEEKDGFDICGMSPLISFTEIIAEIILVTHLGTAKTCHCNHTAL